MKMKMKMKEPTEEGLLADLFLQLTKGNQTLASALGGMSKTEKEGKELIARVWYRLYGYLSPGLRIRVRNEQMVILSKVEEAPGYYLAVEECDGIMERTSVPARVIYCPKSARFAQRCLQDPAEPIRGLLLDEEFQREIGAIGAARKASEQAGIESLRSGEGSVSSGLDKLAELLAKRYPGFGKGENGRDG